MKEKLLMEFGRVFDNFNDVHIFFAPGSVNLIGEHTDYNGGHVFPCALTIGTYAVARKNGSNLLRFYSSNLSNLGVIAISLDELIYNKAYDWCNYPVGVIEVLAKYGYKIMEGLDILYYGNIPSCSGLSSSASIEVVTAYLIRELFSFSYDDTTMAKMAQEAENTFVGVNCGIMDQFAITMGKKDHAIFLDTSDCTYTYAPINLDGMKIVIANTNKLRGLSASKYNERRKECEKALALLRKKKEIQSIGELSINEFESMKNVIHNPDIRKRARHAVYENDRTKKAVQALMDNNIGLFGHLMNESHISLRDDYEVTGIELDTLVEAAWEQKGVLGARMTGAGFGGCAVCVVTNDRVKEFIINIGAKYKEVIGYAASFYVVEIGDGATMIQ